MRNLFFGFLGLAPRTNPNRSRAFLTSGLLLASLLSFTASIQAQEQSPVQLADLSSDLVIRDAQELGPETGFPMPRYVSLKSNLVNLRSGPGFRYPVDWVFQRRLLPLIVIEEFEHWRQIRTHDGIVGWLHKSMITGTRTFRIQKQETQLKSGPLRDSNPLALLEPGVVGTLKKCDLSWCRVEIQVPEAGALAGWLNKKNLFGVGPTEIFRR